MRDHEHETRLKAVLKSMAASHGSHPVRGLRKAFPFFVPAFDGRVVTITEFKSTTLVFVGDRDDLIRKLEGLSIPRPTTSRRAAVKALPGRIRDFLKAVARNNEQVEQERLNNEEYVKKGGQPRVMSHARVDVPVFPDVTTLRRVATEMMGFRQSYYFRRDDVVELQGFLVRKECDDDVVRAAWGMIETYKIMEG